MFSIDQNCHSLWDVLPKLQALSRRRIDLTHFVEDIDVAFTSLGSGVEPSELRIARERFHHSGGADWGAALYYSEFLGRLPADVRDWEPMTGMKTAVLARQLGRTVESLFDEFSCSDNWQLVGPSYVGDRRHHRVIADLSVAETADFLREIIARAGADVLEAFPAARSRARAMEWFRREELVLERLLKQSAGASLPQLYRAWLEEYLHRSVRLSVTSELFAVDGPHARGGMLELFLKDYDLAAGLYNESLAEADVKLRPLRTAEGELPFFAVLSHHDHLVRTPVSVRGQELVVGDRSFRLAPQRRVPADDLAAAAVRCLAGKAVVLVLQVCLEPAGRPLAMPYRGSLYTPASRLLAAKLAARRLLPGRLHPLMRVRFRLLDHMRELDVPIRLPDHLAQCFGEGEVPARRFAEGRAALAAEAARRLKALADPAGREQWQRQNFPDLFATLDQLEGRRRELASAAPKSEEIRDLWKQAKALRNELLASTVRRIARDVQVRDVDYWDSRGALLPWCIALGGERFYAQVVAAAKIYPEPFCPEADAGDGESPPPTS